MKILGISDHYLSGAALVDGGRLVSAVSEERLDRRKMVMGWPRRSIASVLDASGVKPEEVDRVAVASHWGHFLDELVDFSGGVLGADEGRIKSAFLSLGSRLAALRSGVPFLESLYYDLRKPVYARRQARIREVLASEVGLECPVEFVWHHRAHAASAYQASGFDDALVVTLDGSGDGHSSHVYDVRDGRWEFLHSVPSFDGLGNYYGYVTELCGFTMGRHEGKVTGLAAHGEDLYREVLERFLAYADGSMVNVGNAFRHGALAKLRRALPGDFRREDLAASMQLHAERVATRYLAHWRERTGQQRVALAGGVHANVKINQRVHELPGIEETFVYPAMSDEGLAAGAAWCVSAQRCPGEALRGSEAFENAYLGPEYSERKIARSLDARGVPYRHAPHAEAEIAQRLADGAVVARMDGRMEYGPRSLGNRSILVRPDDPRVNDWLNERLGRTEFMPFAPVTLAEEAGRWFQGTAGAENSARFMTITFDCTPEMRERCPGVVHIDGTARPQLVRDEDNPGLVAILREFRKRSGLSSLVNTSFNIHEEPIVCSPDDALRAFEIGHLDVLAIGPFLVERPASAGRREG